MTRLRKLITISLCLGLAILAGCSGSGGGRGGGGGYYKDDGPGSKIPANIEAIPDAVPRLETHAKANFRPYTVFGKRYVPISDEMPFRQEGTASWYGRKFHGQKTANGEVYDMYAMTAAHPTLPIPSYAKVTRAGSGRSVIVRVNDRGPFHSARIIDLSYVAAAKLGLIGPGSGQVIVEAITNQDIRAGVYQRPKATPIPTAPPPVAPPPLIARVSPPTPDALQVLQTSDAADMVDALMVPGMGLPVASRQTASSPAMPPSHVASAAAQAVSSASEGVYLQFGAFSALQTADALAGKLNRQIAQVESRSAHVQSAQDLHRVRIGPYPSRTAAVNAALRIQEQTGYQPAMASR